MSNPPSSNGLQIVFGASGGLGNAVVRALAAQGKRVRGVNRSGRADVPQGVEMAACDGADTARAREVCAGAAVVFHCANAPYTHWPEMFPPLTDSIAEAAAAAGAKLVFGDNLYMYGPVDGPITEECPWAATDRKGRVRIEMANKLLAAHRAGKVRVVIGRASDFYGPGTGAAAMGDRVFLPALEGKTVRLLGDIDAPHTYTFVDDYARALVTLSEREEALGQVWHTPNADTLTTRQFVNLVFEIAGTKPRVQTAPRAIVTVMSWFDPMMREVKEMLYSWEAPYVVSHAKYAQAFGATVTPHAEAIRQTLDWYRGRRPQ